MPVATSPHELAHRAGDVDRLVCAPPQVPRPHRRPWTLLLLEILTGLAALGGAVGLVIDGAGMDPSLLAGTPFASWVWPGLALAVVIGIPMLAAGEAEWRRRRHAAGLSLAAGVVLMGWITVQVAVIGVASWLQPVCFLVGLLITGLALPRAQATLELPRTGR